MTLTDAWQAYMDVLRDCAPVTASAVRPPRVLAEREAAERATASWTEELRGFFALHDGQAFRSEDNQFVGEVLPGVELLSLEQVVATHKLCGETLHPIDDLGPNWPATVRAQRAGETAEMFVPAYIPFAEDGAGDFLYVDTREGEQHGCIRYFAAEAADEGGPLFASLTEYVDSVRRSVESRAEHSYLVPSVTEGALAWEVDFSDRPPMEPQPDPMPLHLPFPLSDFQPSLITSDDDLVDLDVVRAAVLDTARSRHPGAEVQGGEVVFRRVPRQHGVTMNSVVQVDGDPRFYLTIVTGVGNEVLVHELPPGGFTFIVDH
ncbi:SMI1/KNR4 family protein [Rhodococcus sp. WS1]|uniref:SMI1/KNR4 family protein n=1 Tax=unclassified Rhodococcus (in: high G+C Gram-positive bacteria) TaxID=192944 RepID=UPI001143622F|nr:MULTISPECIES: SMI1/KNR4 family protein [unclassified Rhodococcus (in: high G+C Gram-positive bacteria)]ROZ52983.1 SMI1/KNR4 family protein [Rhodococcus sp. WS1]TQC36074.1 SMI1/KNR4 family protein [Rhodococcus sp. WS7]